jgi:D-specific alpha-keto acid dehydrogenase
MTGPKIRITAYGCAPVEADLVRAVAARLGVTATITDAPVALDTVGLATGSRCISVGHRTPVTASVLRALHAAGVRHVSTRSIGLDHVDLAAAARLGIAVRNVAYSPDSVADYTLMLILMGLRSASSTIQRAAVHDYRLGDLPGRELRDLTVGVVGTGRIGAAVIDRLRGFGCRILACDSRPEAPADHVTLDEVLQRSDVVTLHVPLDAGTQHLLDARRLARMKAGALLVNTGRGALVDTEALVRALECGRLGGAALDVLEGEDGVFYRDCRGAPVERPLLERLHRLPNVIITPHTAYYTDHALGDAVTESLLGCLRYEEELRHA